MPEHRSDEIAGGPVSALVVFAHSCCRENLQLVHGHRHGSLMRPYNPCIVTHQRGDGNGFGR